MGGNAYSIPKNQYPICIQSCAYRLEKAPLTWVEERNVKGEVAETI